MAFSEGINRLQRIIEFVSIDYRSKKEIMSYLRQFNIIISYKTLERYLKQIKENFDLDLEYKRNLGYKCENEILLKTQTFTRENLDYKVGFENELYIIINEFDYHGKTYCNCLDKRTKKVFLMQV